MMECIQEMKRRFQALAEIAKKYKFDVTDYDKILQDIENYRVTTPLIGNFSTGKSSMINAIIGAPLLGVDITPETAVPTEVFYGEQDKVLQYTKEGIIEHQMEELPIHDLTIDDTELVTIETNLPFLKEIPRVSVVDLPGMDTKIELHNRAIDEYLPKSLAYLLIVSADEPVLKEGVISLLNELKLHQMPIYVVITKCNRLLDEEVEQCKELIQGLVRNTLDGQEVKIACVDSYGTVKVEEVKEFLREIQGSTEKIFMHQYTRILNRELYLLESCITEIMDKQELSTSEIEYQREKLKKRMDGLFLNLKKEQSRFETEVEECNATIREQVKHDLRENTDEFAVLLENGMDITEKINEVVRNAIIFSIKQELEPKLYKYLENISQVVNIRLENKDEIEAGFRMETTAPQIVDIVKKIAPAVLMAVGLVISGPLAAVAGGIIGAAAGPIFNSTWDRKRERAAREAAEKVVAAIEENAADSATEEIHGYINKVNTVIEQEVMRQHDMLSNSIEQLEIHLKTEEGLKENEIERMKQDLAALRSLTIKKEESNAAGSKGARFS